MAIGGEFDAMLAVWDITSNQVACYCSCHRCMSAFCNAVVEDIAEEGREEENSGYNHLRRRLFHGTMMLGVDGASGEAGDRRLSSKRKSKGFDAPPAVKVGNAENETPYVEPPAPAAALQAAPAAEGAAAASGTQPTPLQPASKSAGGPEVAACARPCSPAPWRIGMKHWLQ